MNFLAHAIFTQDASGDVLFGSVAGDLVKETHPGLPHEVIEGIRLHQALDTLSNSAADPAVTNWRNQLEGVVERWGPPVVDICSDHVIAKNWNRIFDSGLKRFASQVHAIMVPRIPLLPERSQAVATRMIEEGWLISYREREGLEAALERLAKRVSRGAPIRESAQGIMDAVPAIETAFLRVLPTMRQHSEEKLHALGTDFMTEPRLSWKAIDYSKEGSYPGPSARRK